MEKQEKCAEHFINTDEFIVTFEFKPYSFGFSVNNTELTQKLMSYLT